MLSIKIFIKYKDYYNVMWTVEQMEFRKLYSLNKMIIKN